MKLSFAFMLMLATSTWAADWTRFRGPEGSGASNEQGLPTKWSATENIVWRTELPGPGTSSPIVVNNRIYLTSYSGYGLDASDPGDKSQLMRHVVALERAAGKPIWQKEFAPTRKESDYSGGNNTWHGYASSTPASDGQRLYVFFGASGVYCLNLSDGGEIWHADVGSKTTGWGSGNSLVLHDNLVIVNASIESDALIALDKQSGSEVWRTGRVRGARNTPILVDLPGGKTELIVSMPGEPQGAIVGYDPKSGEELWRCQGIPDGGYVCPSVVAHDGVIYAIGGRKNTALAVRAGGRGDVTESHVLWRTNKGSNVSSPVYHQGYLYWVHERQGTAFCLDAKTGETMYQERLDPRPGVVYSSMTAADGKLYAVSQHNGTFVLAARPQFELLAHNTLGDDDNRANASLAVQGGQLLLRNDRYLYCIGDDR
jgi:outer membrane protein assembly factor BamB